jgi:heme/copper-type cytochrome/quinol oxidase subunit 2
MFFYFVLHTHTTTHNHTQPHMGVGNMISINKVKITKFFVILLTIISTNCINDYKTYLDNIEKEKLEDIRRVLMSE